MPTGDPSVLIVEDDRFLSSVLANRLKQSGYTIFQAFDGQEALEMLQREKPGLIILDIIMPRISGFDVLKSISSDPQVSKIPVVVLSNLGQENDVEKAKSFGVVDYRVKVDTPIDNVIEDVKNILNKTP